MGAKQSTNRRRKARADPGQQLEQKKKKQQHLQRLQQPVRQLKLVGAVPMNGFNPVKDIVCLHDGSIVACGSESTLIRWPNPLQSIDTNGSLRKMQMLNSYVGHQGFLTCVTQISSDFIASAALDRTIRVWRISTGKSMDVYNSGAWCIVRLRPTFRQERNDCSGVCNSHSEYFAAGMYDGSIVTFNVSDSGVLEQMQHVRQRLANTICLCELDCRVADRSDNAAGPLVIASSNDAKLRIWNAISGAPVKWFFCNESTLDPNEPATAMVILRYNRSSSLLATGSKRGIIKLWNHEDLITSVDPDAEKVDIRWNIAVENKFTVAIEPVRVLKGHGNEITKLIDLPDGTLLSSSTDKTIRLWDTDSGECLMIETMELGVLSMALLSDNCSIAVGMNHHLTLFKLHWLR